MPSLVEIGPVVMEKKMKGKSLQTDRWTDRQQATGDQKSSLELSAISRTYKIDKPNNIHLTDCGIIIVHVGSMFVDFLGYPHL